MIVEILAKGKIENVLKDNGVKFNRTYNGDEYKVMEIEKNDLNILAGVMLDDNVWWLHSKGARTGSACDFFRINGHDIIGWGGKKDNYKTLLDYFAEELNVIAPEDICDYAVSLAKVNGMSIGRLFKECEG